MSRDQEARGLQEIEDRGHVVNSISQLEEYDIINWIDNVATQTTEEKGGFTLFKEGRELTGIKSDLIAISSVRQKIENNN